MEVEMINSSKLENWSICEIYLLIIFKYCIDDLYITAEHILLLSLIFVAMFHIVKFNVNDFSYTFR